MRNAIILIILCASVFVIPGCSNVAGDIETQVVKEEAAPKTQEVGGKEDIIEKPELEKKEDTTIVSVDKQFVISKYETSKQEFGRYYYIWDSNKYEIPLLLVTDDCIEEGEEVFTPGSAYNCKIYYADPEDNYSITEIGELEAPSASYPITEDDDGLYVAFHHYVYQYIPDYTAKKIVVWNGFEDDVVSNIKEHSGFIEIKEGNINEVESVDMDAAYEIYNSASVIVFEKTGDEPKEIDQYYHLSKELDPDGIMENCTISLSEGGKYREFEGNIGDVKGCYKDKDLNGDGKSDEIIRKKGEGDYGTGYYYIVSFSDGSEIQTKMFSSLPNEGEIIEYKDINGDGISEILFVHYTESTGGPIAWDVYLYYEKSGKWESVTIVDEKTRFTDVADACGFKSFDEGGPTPVGVELIDDGIAMLFDHGYKDGPDQTFDYDVVVLSFDSGSLSVTNHSKELVNKYWPLIAD